MRDCWFIFTWNFNLSVLVSARWEELPLSELHRESLRKAVINLPFFLGSPKTALDDDEVVGFTQNGGWQKVDNLVPLLYRFDPWFRGHCRDWIRAVREISDRRRLKVSHSFLRRGGP